MSTGLDAVGALTDEEVASLNAHWRAANYLAAGQIYLMANPLLYQPLRAEQIKPRLRPLGTLPGLNLVDTHLNRIIKNRDQDAICVWGPGHARGPAARQGPRLDGSYTGHYPDLTRDGAGMARLFRELPFPGGAPSHVAPQTPGSIHEGGELGYS